MLADFNPNESIAFLEIAADHLRDAGYSVELDIDNSTGAVCVYVENYEIRFVKARDHDRTQGR